MGEPDQPRPTVFERKAVEEAFRESEGHLATIFQALPLGVAMLDANGNIVMANQAMNRFIPNNVIPSRDDHQHERWQGYHPDGRRIERHNYPGARALRGETVSPGVEFMFRQDDGTHLWTRVSAVPLRDHEGRIAGALTTVVDIDVVKRAQDAVRESRSALQSFYDSSPLLMGIAEIEGDQIYVAEANAAAAQFLGLPEHFSGRAAKDFAPPAANEVWLEHYRRAQREGRPVRFEYLHRGQTGGRWLSATVTWFGRAATGRDRFSFVAEDSTDRKKAEQEISRNAERYRRMSEIEGVGVVTFEVTTGTVVQANAGFLQMTGHTREAVEQRKLNWRQMTPPEHTPVTLAELEKLARTGRIGPYEKEYFRADGSRSWMLYAGAGLGDGTVVEYCINIDDRKRAEAALRASDLRFRVLVENINDYAIFMTDARGYITEWTPGAQRVTGYAAEEVIGSHLSIFYTPEDVAAGLVDQELQEAARTGRAEREQFRVRKGGERFWGNEIATAIRDGGGNLLGFAKIARDLSDRKRSEDMLRESEERFRLLVETVRDHAIFTIDPAGSITTWNPAAERIFGYTSAEAIGRAGADLFTPEDRALGEHEKELAAAAREGRASDDRWQLRKDGSRFWASGVTSAMRTADGRLRGFTKVLRDETASKLLAEKRDRLLSQEQPSLRDAHQAMTMKDEFLAVVSHELRTPLSAILLWAKVLRGGNVDKHQQIEGLESILRSAEAQKHLIEDLLDVSRMISGKLRLNVREAELAPVVQAAVEAVRVTADAKGVDLDVAIEQGAGLLRIDPERIQQVLWNLVSNAVKFTSAGGRVSVRLERTPTAFAITVSDTGRGISPEFLPYMFERFRQADASTTRTHGGLGLGMAISRQLVELHGGTIHVHSAGIGKGSTFRVELPLDAPASSPRTVPAAAPNEDSDAPDGAALLAGLRVLLVEDDPETREAVRHVLEMTGAQVYTAESVPAALDAFMSEMHKAPFGLIISDVGMPEQTGHDLIRQLRQAERSRGRRPTPAIALTAYVRDQDRDQALLAGFDLHIAKPVDPGSLTRAASRLVRSAQE